MQYYSTNHNAPKVTLKEAIIHSEAPDGGLYMPEGLRRLPEAIFKNFSEMSPIEISYFVANTLLGSDLPSSEIKRICEDALNFPIPLVKIEPGVYALELFHGPTMSVKDISTRFMARTLSSLNPNPCKPLNVMVATTGNSGCALANGFHGVEGVNVFAIYPNSTPDYLVAQFTLGGNVHAVGINGTIDDCRAIVKHTLADHELCEQVNFTCANSVNIGRVLPLIIPYFLAISQVRKAEGHSRNIEFAVPSGNCGSLVAGAFAKKMGLPMAQLIAACNSNGSMANFLNGDEASMARPSRRTLAYAMDCNRPANIPRFKEICRGLHSRLSPFLSASVCSDDKIASTIIDVADRTGYLLDPHSAAAYASLKEHGSKDSIGVVLATAHPGRSATPISKILNRPIELPEQLRRFVRGRGEETHLPPTYAAWKKYIRKVVENES